MGAAVPKARLPKARLQIAHPGKPPEPAAAMEKNLMEGKTLVTGGAGFVGCNLVCNLLRGGRDHAAFKFAAFKFCMARVEMAEVEKVYHLFAGRSPQRLRQREDRGQPRAGRSRFLRLSARRPAPLRHRHPQGGEPPRPEQPAYGAAPVGTGRRRHQRAVT